MGATSSGAEVFGRPAGASGAVADSRDARGAGGWTVVVMTFQGPEAKRAAEAMLPIIQRDAGLPEAYLEHRAKGSIIAVGRFDDPERRDAQETRDRVRRITLQGRPAFPTAFLAPRSAGGFRGSIPELDLANAPRLFGERAQYTLQMGVYESDDRRQAMRLAEEAALRLRRDGELAFYYHGPNRSMVTIGVFGADAFDAGSGRFTSMELLELQQRRPHNLYNGAGIEERRPGQPSRLQPSQLVRIP